MPDALTDSTSRSTESDPRFSASLREGETVAGKYLVGRTLGLGGMGVVFAARDTLLDRRVAIKVLLARPVTWQTATQRLVREARAASRITSEHVVKLLEIDTLPDGTPLLVMEYLEGRDLRAVLREDGPLAPERAVDYLLQALQAVAEGHLQTIVHRDLKPSNLFLTARADGTPLIKVLDFGIAKTLEPESSDTFSLTSSEDVRLGSPTYMPPEQLQNPRDVDSRSDIWSLGVTLHELVCGSPPFRGQTYTELLSHILSAEPEPLKARSSGVALPDGLAGVVAKCLQKNREFRYKNAAELATALAPFGSDDARLSLTRVTGLSRGRARTPVPESIARDSLGTCDPTLPVPIDHALSQRLTTTSSGTRSVALPKSQGRFVVIFGVAAAGAIFGSLILRQAQEAAPSRAAAVTQTPSVLAPSISALRLAPDPAPSAGAAASASATTNVAPKSMANRPADSARHSQPAALAGATTNAPRKTTSHDAPATQPARQSAAPANTESAPSELGPSPLIESLIEQRH